MDFTILYEDNDCMAIDKPAGIIVFPEGESARPSFAKASAGETKTLIDYLIEQKPELAQAGEAPRYGVVHRLDKDTSGVLLVAKTTEALIFLQKQFRNRGVEKKYLALATGVLKQDSGTIEARIGRSPADPRKQKAYKQGELTPESAREAVTEFKVQQRFTSYTLLEVRMQTGRKHQIRCHLAFAHHPIAGDKLYGFKDSPMPEGLTRQFLHASFLKIQLPSGHMKEFHSDLPEELRNILNTLQ